MVAAVTDREAAREAAAAAAADLAARRRERALAAAFAALVVAVSRSKRARILRARVGDTAQPHALCVCVSAHHRPSAPGPCSCLQAEAHWAAALSYRVFVCWREVAGGFGVCSGAVPEAVAELYDGGCCDPAPSPLAPSRLSLPPQRRPTAGR